MEITAENRAKTQLSSFIERVERLEEEKYAINSDIKDVFAEAKSTGFDVPAIKKVIALRKLDYSDRMEMEAILGTYLSALGME